MRFILVALIGLGIAGFSAEAAAPAKKKGARTEYSPKTDNNGNPIVPTDPEELAKFTMWSKDKNKDGKLDKAEAGLNAEGFKAVDTNGDGFLSLKELFTYIQSQKTEKNEKSDKAKK